MKRVVKFNTREEVRVVLKVEDVFSLEGRLPDLESIKTLTSDW